MRILVVEDEPLLRQGLRDLLTQAEHSVNAVSDGETAVHEGTRTVYDLVLLDLMLPRLDGIEVCRRLRMVRPALPILVLTARGDEEDKVKGLAAGADDYITKPFGARELLARIDALGRRTRLAPEEPEWIEADGCRLDLSRCEGSRDGRSFSLTAREVGLLRWLYRHRGRAIPRPELLERVWDARPDMETRTVDMAVANLRQKIEQDGANPRIVVTVKGVGYTWGSD
jgi:DNA-binding response OmpR family regulator